MQDCKVCGRSFDPLRFQVVVPELGRGFDRLECAQSARALAGPGSRIAAAPLLAVVEPITASLSPAGPAFPTRHANVPVATLGLLAAGTAAALFLWLRVLGPDTTSFTLGQLAAPPALGHETVQAHVQPAPPRSAPDMVSPAEHRGPATVTTLVSTRPSMTTPRSQRGSQTSTKERSPSRPARPSTRPASAKLTGKGHAKHGKGHYKHGETDGVHESGGHKSHGHGKSKKH